MGQHTRGAVLYPLLLLAFSSLFAFAEAPPDVRIKIYCSVGTPPPEMSGWAFQASDSLADFKKALLDRQDWIEVVESPEKADLNAIIMGRQESTRPGYETLYMVWIAVKKGSDYYSLFGARSFPCFSCWRDASGAAAGMVISWVKINYDLIRENQAIPGGLNVPTFSMPLGKGERVQSGPKGPRLKVFCDAGETPALYRKGWADGKSDSVNDLKEKIRKNSRWMELTDQRQNADFVLEVLGRQWMFSSNVLWIQVIIAGQKTPVSFPLFLATWKQTAENVVYRLDLWAAQVNGDIRKLNAAVASGMQISGPPASGTQTEKPAALGSYSSYAVLDGQRIVKESAIGKQKLAALNEFKQQQSDEIKKKHLSGSEVAQRDAEMQKRLSQALAEIEAITLPVIKKLGEERGYDCILGAEDLAKIRNDNKQAVVVRLQTKDVIYYKPDRPINIDLTTQAVDDLTDEIIRRMNLK